MSILTGCNTKNKTEIEQSFDKVLEMYPTKNLEDFYDMEGYRDGEFDEEDKGVWVLNSVMSIRETEDSYLHSEGMVLRMNRNTKKAKGYYHVRDTPKDIKNPTKEKKYPVFYDGKKIQPLEKISDKEILDKINNFRFFVQYGSFDKLDTYKNINKMYNPEVPIYELEYELTEEDNNVKALKDRYDIPKTDAPKLKLKGRGDLEGSSVGYKNVEFRFSQHPPINFRDYIDFQPQNMEDLENE
jgi:uncharacterized lipoprotein (TIGR01742 family)